MKKCPLIRKFGKEQPFLGADSLHEFYNPTLWINLFCHEAKIVSTLLTS